MLSSFPIYVEEPLEYEPSENEGIFYASLTEKQKRAYVVRKMSHIHDVLRARDRNDFTELAKLCKWDARTQESFHLDLRVAFGREEYPLFKSFAERILRNLQKDQNIFVEPLGKYYFSASFSKSSGGLFIIPSVDDLFANNDKSHCCGENIEIIVDTSYLDNVEGKDEDIDRGNDEGNDSFSEVFGALPNDGRLSNDDEVDDIEQISGMIDAMGDDFDCDREKFSYWGMNAPK